MNNTTIHGRLTRDPELNSYTNAKGEQGSICTFTVAVNRRIGDEADFFTCKIFGKRAEVINKWFRKGSEIVCAGQMQCNPYTDKENVKRYPWNLMVDNFDFCGAKKDSQESNDTNNEASFQEVDAVLPF